MDSQIFRRTVVTLVLGLVFLAGPVFAACTQADLTGTWYLNGVNSSLYTGSVNETSNCKVKFGSAGAVLGGSSSCQSRSFFGSRVVNIHSGSVTVNEFCALKGSINYCTAGFCSAIVVTGSRMDVNKSTIAFLGFAAYDSNIIFDWTGVKK